MSEEKTNVMPLGAYTVQIVNAVPLWWSPDKVMATFKVLKKNTLCFNKNNNGKFKWEKDHRFDGLEFDTELMLPMDPRFPEERDRVLRILDLPKTQPGDSMEWRDPDPRDLIGKVCVLQLCSDEYTNWIIRYISKDYDNYYIPLDCREE